MNLTLISKKDEGDLTLISGEEPDRDLTIISEADTFLQ